jgi:methionyl-tRNA formyltransferase
MKPFHILFITQEDPFYVRLFFEEFFKRYDPTEDVKGVIVAPTMGKKSVKKLIRQMYDFYGPVDFVRIGARYAWHKTCDLLSRVVPLRRFHSISQVCRHYNVPVNACANINGEEFLETLRQMDLDLIISVAAPQIFKEPLIRIPRHGCINIHNAKLPKYRGMLPNFWQIFHGETSVGTTIHRINAGIDDGEILLQKETPLLNGESLDSIIRRTKTLGGQFMIEAINGLKRHSLTPLPNPSKDSTYFSFPTKQDVLEFKKRGHRLI